MSQVAKRFDAEAIHWADNKATDIISHERNQRLQYTLSELQKRNPKTILEIGCGAGFNLQAIAKVLPHAKCVGVDISPEMIRLCKEKNKKKNITFQVLDIDKKILKQKFDAVVILGVIGYTPNVSHTLTQIKKHLAQDGYLMFTYGNSQSFFRKIRAFLSSILDNNQLLQNTYNSAKKSVSSKTVAYNPNANNFACYKQSKIESELRDLKKKKQRNMCFAVGFPVLWKIKNWILEPLFRKNDPLKLALTVWVSYQK